MYVKKFTWDLFIGLKVQTKYWSTSRYKTCRPI